MRPTAFRWIVIPSLLIAAAAGATRPRYGGTLHVQLYESLNSLDPADHNQPNTPTVRSIYALVFDTLVSLDDRGQAQPRLALSWQADSGNQSWRFVVRPGVMFSDGTAVTPEVLAACLRRANPTWKLLTTDTTITIQLDAASSDLPAELALRRNSIAKLDNGRLLGTGPFVISHWDPGKKLVLTARDDYWNGRPFLDSIEIELGRNFRDETISFELGQSQLVEIPPDQAHRAIEARQLHTSEPVELVALLFAQDVQSPEDAKQRQALALCIDRTLLNRVVLQGGGEAAGTLLPNWLTGYGFLFPAEPNLTRAQQLRAEVPQSSLWTLGFDVSDPLARLLAERIVLNASDAGLRLQFASSGAPDIQLVRTDLASLDPHVGLAELARTLGVAAPRYLGPSTDDLYHAENVMVQSQRTIPLLHLRTAWAVSKTVRNWEDTPDGTWRLPNVWLAAGKP
jgi:ABC-type transport system substrate-binding protein